MNEQILSTDPCTVAQERNMVWCDVRHVRRTHARIHLSTRSCFTSALIHNPLIGVVVWIGLSLCVGVLDFTIPGVMNNSACISSTATFLGGSCMYLEYSIPPHGLRRESGRPICTYGTTCSWFDMYVFPCTCYTLTCASQRAHGDKVDRRRIERCCQIASFWRVCENLKLTLIKWNSLAISKG